MLRVVGCASSFKRAFTVGAELTILIPGIAGSLLALWC
jgi:hypothetical protein